MDLTEAIAELPLVAILRGIRPAEAHEAAGALVEAGFRLIEVPLNSPDPLISIERIAATLGDHAIVGAGTVLAAEDVGRLADAGGRLVVMPHSDPAVIRAAKARRLHCLPGVATPTEAFAALAAGADGLKVFPAEATPPPVIKAWRAVVPKSLGLFPVGGITPESMAPFVAAGATGFGLGSALYLPGRPAGELARRAEAFVKAWRSIGVPP